jgi:hypothetical protein
LLAEAVSTSDSSAASTLVELTRALVGSIRSQLAIVGFWENATKQDEMRKSVKIQLDDSHLFEYATLDALSVNVVDVAKANQRKLT